MTRPDFIPGRSWLASLALIGPRDLSLWPLYSLWPPCDFYPRVIVHKQAPFLAWPWVVDHAYPGTIGFIYTGRRRVGRTFLAGVGLGRFYYVPKDL